MMVATIGTCTNVSMVNWYNVPMAPYDEALHPPNATTRFAVCFAGQIRSGRHSFLIENLKTRLLDPLQADVFVEVSTEERDTLYHSVSKAEAFYYQHMLAPVHMRLATDGEMEAELKTVADSERSRGAIGARWRSCLRRIKEAEAKRGKPYEYIFRLRTDAVFPCKIAPPDAWPAITTQRSLLFHSNEAFLATRQAAEFALNLTITHEHKLTEQTASTPGLFWWLHRNGVSMKQWPRPSTPQMKLSCTTTFCKHTVAEDHTKSNVETCERPCLPGMESVCSFTATRRRTVKAWDQMSQGCKDAFYLDERFDLVPVPAMDAVRLNLTAAIGVADARDPNKTEAYNAWKKNMDTEVGHGNIYVVLKYDELDPMSMHLENFDFEGVTVTNLAGRVHISCICNICLRLSIFISHTG